MFPALLLVACAALADGPPTAALARQGAEKQSLPAGAIVRLKTGGQKNIPICSLLFTRDGKLLIGASPVGIRVWDAGTGDEVSLWQDQHDEVVSLALAPDGRLLASGGKDRLVRLWDMSTGKQLRTLAGHQGTVWAVAFSPDGNLLASAGEDATIRLWNPRSGAELRRFAERNFPVYSVAFSPDALVLASGGKERPIRLWDVATGRQVRQLTGHANRVHCVTFSPDGRALASASRDSTVRLWDPASGERTGELAGYDGEVKAVAFSADGKTLAAACKEPTVRFWEVITGKERGKRSGHQASVLAVAFSPDGKGLASSGADGTIFIWDLTGLPQLPKPEVRTLPKRELEALWADLASKDARRAYQAIWRLVQAADQSVSFLDTRIRTEFDDPRRIDRLIAELDNDRFEIRSRATSELQALGKLAEPAVREILKSKPSLELRLRADQFLHGLEDGEQPPILLRLLRAFEVLEHIGSPKARQVLRRAAQGSAEGRLTREAKAAVERLARRLDR